jgi:hypothetical protein
VSCNSGVLQRDLTRFLAPHKSQGALAMGNQPKHSLGLIYEDLHWLDYQGFTSPILHAQLGLRGGIKMGLATLLTCALAASIPL